MIRKTWLVSMAALLPVLTATAAGCSLSDGKGGKGGKDCGIAFVFREPLGSEQSLQDTRVGVQRAGRETGTKVRIVEAAGLKSFENNMRAVSAKGCYSAIGTVYVGSDETVTKMAKQFPDQRYFTVQGNAVGPNVTNYANIPEQLTFVAGAIAAKATKGKTIGIVLGVDIPSVRRWKNGFVQGARFTDPSVKVLVNFVGSFTDPAKTATVAVGQAEQKADLIFVASGANLEASRQGAAHGFRTISTNVDEYAQEMKRGDDIAFAAADRMDDLAYKAVLDLRSANPAKGTRSFGLADSVFAITQLTSDKLPGTRPLPEPVLDAGRRAKEGLTSHQVTVRNPEA